MRKKDLGGKKEMKRRNTGKWLFLCLAGLACSLSACSLATEEGGRLAGEDELVGVYVTLEHAEIPSASEVEVKRTASGAFELVNGEEEEGRLYGELDPVKNEVTFPGIEGYAFLNVTLPMENGEGDYITTIASEQFYDITSELGGGNLNMKGVIAFDSTCPSGGRQPDDGTPGTDSRVFYANPVYMTADGEIYLVNMPGIGGQVQGPMEIAYQTEHKENVNGGSSSAVRKVTLTIQPSVPLASAVFSQMAEDGTLLCREEFRFEQLPDHLDREEGTAYTLVELKDVLGEVRYDILNREDTEYMMYGLDGGPILSPFRMQLDEAQ